MEAAKEQPCIKGKVKIITYKAGTKEILRETDFTPNRIMLGTNTGKTLILQRLGCDNTYSLNPTYAEIGTGITTPADADVALAAPVVRAAFANSSISGNILSNFYFFSDGVLANGTYYEFGTFIDGTATIGTGKIFNRVLFSVPYTKASGEDTTVQLDITIT